MAAGSPTAFGSGTAKHVRMCRASGRAMSRNPAKPAPSSCMSGNRACAGTSFARCPPNRSVNEIMKYLTPLSSANWARSVGHGFRSLSSIVMFRKGRQTASPTPLSVNSQPVPAFPGYPVGSGKRHPGHGRGLHCHAPRVLRLQVVNVALATGPRDGLRLKRHHLEVVATDAPTRDRVETAPSSSGSCVVMPAGSRPSCQSS